MSAQVPPIKRNNYFKTGNITQQIKYLVGFETLLGINRLYVCGYRTWTLWFSYIYDLLLLLLVVFFFITDVLGKFTQHLYKGVSVVEYLLLFFSALFLQKNKLRKFFSSLQTFDENLNISNEVSLLTSKRWYLYGIGVVVLYSFLENLHFMFFILQMSEISFLSYVIYLPVIAHDVEIIFFCYLLIIILKRLAVLKAHVAKVFSININDRIDCENSDKLVAFTKRVNLDVTSLHKSYELLYKCADQLNAVMSISMIVMIVTSGLSTIIILKNTIKMIPSVAAYMNVQSLVVFSVGRSLKYILLLTLPCYISNKTEVQVSVIRTMVHDTMNTIEIAKIERRKIKAFFHLVCEHKFAYALCGIINLDMSLPLSYSSLCTTYLIIVVQFSKFFD